MTATRKVGGVVFLIWASALVLAWKGGPPILYCGWQKFIWPLLQPYASLGLFVTALYFAWSTVRHGVVSGSTAGALLLMFAIGAADDWARILLGLGKTCT